MAMKDIFYCCCCWCCYCCGDVVDDFVVFFFFSRKRDRDGEVGEEGVEGELDVKSAVDGCVGGEFEMLG